eukprot:2457087-Prymnesium_polylepis.1
MERAMYRASMLDGKSSDDLSNIISEMFLISRKLIDTGDLECENCSKFVGLSIKGVTTMTQKSAKCKELEHLQMMLERNERARTKLIERLQHIPSDSRDLVGLVRENEELLHRILTTERNSREYTQLTQDLKRNREALVEANQSLTIRDITRIKKEMAENETERKKIQARIRIEIKNKS